MKLLLVDDHPAVLSGLKALLGTEHDMEIVGEARSVEEGLRLTERLRPDLVILDLQLPGGVDGLEGCRRLKALDTAPRVLFYTGHRSSECLAHAVLAGANGYFHKGAYHAKLADTVRRVSRGEQTWVVDVEPSEDPGFERSVRAAGLTPKETEVLGLVLRRYTNAEVAEELFIGVSTVKGHITSIMRKLGARRRRDLLRGRMTY